MELYIHVASYLSYFYFLFSYVGIIITVSVVVVVLLYLCFTQLHLIFTLNYILKANIALFTPIHLFDDLREHAASKPR